MPSMKRSFSERERVRFFKQFSLSEWETLNRIPRFMRALRKNDLIIAGEIASEALRRNNWIHKRQKQIDDSHQTKLSFFNK
jgi:hypothetical protein